MLMTKKTHGLLLATTAAALFAAAPIVAADQGKSEDTVHCAGVNACKGQSDCKGAHNACKGENACKGQGFKIMTKSQCEAAGGTPE